MTDRELIAKKLSLIETSVRELKTLSRPSEIPRDRVQERRLDDLLRFVTLIRSKLA